MCWRLCASMTPLGAHRLPVSCGPYPHTCTLHSRVRSTLAQAHAAHVAAHTCGLPIHTSDRCAHTHAHPALTHRLAPGCCCFGASSQSASISFLFPRRAGPCRDTQAAVAVGQSSARAQHMFVYNMSLEGSAECCARPRGREPRLSLHSRWRREGASSAAQFEMEKEGSLVCHLIPDGEGRKPRLPLHSRWITWRFGHQPNSLCMHSSQALVTAAPPGHYSDTRAAAAAAGLPLQPGPPP